MKVTLEEWRRCGCPPINVRFNGLTARRCIAADEEAGTVEILDVENFRHIEDKFPTKVLNGDVRIIVGDFVKRV